MAAVQSQEPSLREQRNKEIYAAKDLEYDLEYKEYMTKKQRIVICPYNYDHGRFYRRICDCGYDHNNNSEPKKPHDYDKRHPKKVVNDTPPVVKKRTAKAPVQHVSILDDPIVQGAINDRIVVIEAEIEGRYQDERMTIDVMNQELEQNQAEYDQRLAEAIEVAIVKDRNRITMEVQQEMNIVAKKKLFELHGEIERLTKEIERTENMYIARMKEERDRIQRECEKKIDVYLRCNQAEINRHQIEINRHQIEITQKDDRILDLQIQLEAQPRIAELEEELSETQEQLDDVITDRDRVQRDLAQVRIDRDQQIQKINGLEAKLSAARDERDEYRQQLKDGAGASPTVAADTDPRCVICMTNVPNVVLTPCYHMVSCNDCTAGMLNANNRCPMCRTIVGTHHRVFTS